jgi:hypothetical protein
VSLLDSGTDVLLVYVEQNVTDGRGNPIRVPAASATPVVGAVHPVTTEEATALGQTVDTVRSFTGKSFPGGPWARVHWDGRDWQVHGEPVFYRRGAATRHVSVILVFEGQPPLPVSA